MNYVYILECSDGSLYTGWTTDLDKRFKMHIEGTGAKYTKAHKPVRIVYVEEFNTKSDALKREYAIKQLTRNEKLMIVNANHLKCDD